HLNGPRGCFRLHQFQRVFGEHADITCGSLRSMLARIVEEHPDDAGDPLDLADYNPQSILDLGRRGPAAQKKFRAPSDHTEWRANLVGKAGGEGSYAG